MAFKDLLVQVDDTKPCGVRLELAARLAHDNDAHLVGLYVAPRYDIPAYARVQLGPEAWAAHDRNLREAIAKVEAQFRDYAKRAGLNAEWRSAEGIPADITALHARYADLAILGQANPDDETASPYGRVPEDVALAAGRPVLVIPYAGKFSGAFERVLVAWNVSREAARAVNDALPLLQRAKHVSVLAINPHGGPGGHGEVPSADISLHLARHGVNVEASHIQASDIDVGNMLLSRAADAAADLIVMGAYGRSRVRELVLGGVTRHLLQHMTVPVLMSH